MASTLTFDNPVFAQFAFYGTVCVFKTMVMSLITIKQRLSRKVVANMEDRLVKGQTTIFNDVVVERTRRCHQNDVENVIPFILVGVLYVLTGPDPWWAAFHFRLFTGCRICHTIAYLFAIPQPARASMFGIGWLTVVSMGVSVLMRGKF
ncbi:microsomal glutathione S-transferase 1-like [Pecten maximus]|uniref:microsomal glutathione S-transferase 1-like n=1 Tax=Pecten maximus TaxID=6579 RepID=UPI0014589EFA|nr:microsomal glutathione S-transferase 1-like [Pecten maximus]